MVENVMPRMPKTNNANEFMLEIKEYSQLNVVDKSILGTLLSELTAKKFDWSQLRNKKSKKSTDISVKYWLLTKVDKIFSTNSWLTIFLVFYRQFRQYF